MQTFVKINLGDIVFDKESRQSGKVSFIDFKKSTAKLEVIIDSNKEEATRTTKLYDVRLANLVVVDKAKKKPNNSNKQWNLVRTFHKLFGHPIAETPQPISLERMIARSVWTVEELIESIHASSNHEEEFLKAVAELVEGITKAVDKSIKEDYPQSDFDRVVAQVDGLIDSLYFINGTLVEMGVKPDKPFEIVQNSNLSKLFTDDKGNKYAKYREDGKILKSPEFFQPEPFLCEEIKRQMNQK